MTVNEMTYSKMNKTLIDLASAKIINSAKDDVAGFSTAEQLEAQINGLYKGIENTADMSNLIKTADSGLEQISDSLQRVRELSVQASNGIYGDSEKKIIQNEINGLMENINDISKNTNFNGVNLLDGSFQDKNTASFANGIGKQIFIGGVSIDQLNLSHYNVTGDFDISAIDRAISAVTDTRSSLGADFNTFQYTMDSNSITLLNLAAAQSRITDTDYAKETITANVNQVMEQYKSVMQTADITTQIEEVGAILA